MTTQIALELRGRMQNLHATHTTSATSCLQQSSRWAALQASARAHDRPDHLFPSPYWSSFSGVPSKPLFLFTNKESSDTLEHLLKAPAHMHNTHCDGDHMHVRNSSVIVCTSTLRVNVDSCVVGTRSRPQFFGAEPAAAPLHTHAASQVGSRRS